MRCSQSNITRYSISSFTLMGTLILLSTLLFTSCQKDDDGNGEEPILNAIDLQLIGEGFTSPIQVVGPRHSERLYIVDQIGKIWVIDGKGYKRPTPMLDLSDRIVPLNPNNDERGLIGMALHPEFKTNGRFFVYYQVPPRPGGPSTGATWNNLSRISEFKVLPDVLRADMASERIILEWDDPQANHNGGTLCFGLDDYLYISIGDGGGANDVAPGHVDDWYPANGGGNAQNIDANFLGKILRIDIDAGMPYGIPAGNPFIDKPGLDEIFAFGFRNPYRMSFDIRGTKDLIVADAGQALYEEVNVISKGGNYGWNVKEGNHCFNAANNKQVLDSCPAVDNRGKEFINPVLELNNWQNPAGGSATTIIGGYVYRGETIKDWVGKYIFGTFSQSATTADGQIFVANTGSTPWTYEKAKLKSHPDNIGHYLKGFGQDDDGEIYIAVSSQAGPQGTSGKVYMLAAVEE